MTEDRKDNLDLIAGAQSFSTNAPLLLHALLAMVPPDFVWDPESSTGVLSAGFRTMPEIPEDISLRVSGTIPAYVDGRLYRNGPGLYELTHKNGETTHINHWFDGIATVHRFRINGATGTVEYKNRRTMPAAVSIAEHAPSKAAYKAYLMGEQDPCRGILGTLFQMWRPLSVDPVTGTTHANANVSLERIPGTGKLVARTDANVGAVLDIDTLDPKIRFSFADLNPKLGMTATAAHGVTDPDTGEYFNYCYNYGLTPVEYSVFAHAPGAKNRILAKIQDTPCYLHSLTATKNYVILIMYSCAVNALKLLTGTSFSASLAFRPSQRVKFYVISRSEEKLKAVYDSAAFFCFHNINAFEDESGNIQLDLVQYKDGRVLSEFYRNYLISKPPSFFSESVPKRFTLHDVQSTANAFAKDPTAIAEASVRLLADVSIELPRIASAREMRTYQFVYGVSTQRENPYLIRL